MRVDVLAGEARLTVRAALGYAGLLLLGACGGEAAGTRWAGTIDTLPGGKVVVTNPAAAAWDSATAWRVVEEVRIGAEDGDGPEVLGRIGVLAEDAQDRIWALESQDQQFKVFDGAGRFVRMVGRQGGGPGELRQVAGVTRLPDGRMLVVDPQGARLSWFDSAGTFLNSFTTSGGFSIFPWPGGVDRDGSLYQPVPRPSDEGFSFVLVRHDSSMTPLDTLVPPRWQGPTNAFEHRTTDGFMSATVPHSPGLSWRLTRDGDIWFVHTGSYELFRMNRAGDTVRAVSKPFDPVPVTGAEKDSAVARLSWFTQQGGTVDRGRIPDVKPAVQYFLVADDGHLWVSATRADSAAQSRTFDVFDPEGRYLGPVRLPFVPQGYPLPVITGSHILAMTQDEGGVPYIVRARIEKPEAREVP